MFVNAIFVFGIRFSRIASLSFSFLRCSLYYGFYIVLLLCVAKDTIARLASQHELIRLTYLPDTLGPPCTDDARVAPHVYTCIYMYVCMYMKLYRRDWRVRRHRDAAFYFKRHLGIAGWKRAIVFSIENRRDEQQRRYLMTSKYFYERWCKYKRCKYRNKTNSMTINVVYKRESALSQYAWQFWW